MAISAKSVGTWASTGTTAATSTTVTLPTHAAGDMLIVRAGCKPYNSAPAINTTGWNPVANAYSNGTTGAGNGLGSVVIRAWYKIAASSSETNPVVSWNTNSATPGAVIAVCYQKAASGENWDTPVGAGGGDDTARTSQTATMGSHISVTAGDMIDFFVFTRDDSVTTNPTITQTGVTYNTVAEYPATAHTSGDSNDCAADGGYRLASSGTSSAAAVVTHTNAATESGAAWQTRLRVISSTQSGAAAFTSESTFTAAGTITHKASVAFTAEASLRRRADPATERGTFEAGTNGNAISTTENIGGLTIDSGSSAGAGAMTFSNAQAKRGSLSAKVDMPTANTDWVWRAIHLGSSPTAAKLSAYMYIPSVDVVTTGITLIQFMTSTTPVAQIFLSTSQTLLIRDQATQAVGSSAIDFDPYFDSWVRFDFEIDLTADTQTLWVYHGDNLESNDPNDAVATTSGTAAAQASTDRIRIGMSVPTAAAFTYYVDDVAWSTTTMPGSSLNDGPYAKVTAGPVYGAANFSAEASLQGGYTDSATEKEYFESGNDADAIGTTYGIFDGGLDTGSATWEIDTARVNRGSRAALVTIPASGASYRSIDISASNQTVSHFRTYLYMPTVDIVGAAMLVQAYKLGSNLEARLALDATQWLVMQDTTTTVGTGIDFDDETSDGNNLFDRWLRLEWKLDQLNTLQTVRLFWGSNLNGTTPDFEESAAFTSTAGAMQFRLGATGTITSGLSVSYDNIGWKLSDWAGPVISIGPNATVTPGSGPVTHYAAAAFTSESTFTAAGSRKALVSAAFTSESTFVPTGSIKVTASAAFTSESTFTAAGSRKALVSAAFTSESTFTAAGSRKALVSAAFTSESTFTAVGSVPFEEIELFDSGSNGANYTITSGISDTGIGTGFIYSEAARVTGLNGARVTFTTGNLQTRRITFGGSPSDTIIWCRMIVKTPAPDAVFIIAAIRDSSLATLAAVRVNADGTIAIRDGIITRATSTYAFDNTEFIQIAFGFSGGLVRMRLYDLQGNLLESELSGTYSGTTTPFELAWGITSSPTTSPYVIDYDEVGYNTAQEIRPLGLYFGIAAFSAQSSLTATATIIHKAAAAFTSESTFTASATRTALVSAEFTSESTFVATATKIIYASAAFTAESTFVPTATKIIYTSAAFTAQSSMTATVASSSVAYRNALTYREAGLLYRPTSSGATTHNAIVTFSAESTLSAVASRTVVVSAAFTSETTFVSTATKIIYASVVFTAESTFSTIGSRKAVVSAAFTSESDFTVSGKRISIALAAFTAETTFVPTATKTIYASTAFTAESTFVPTATKKVYASAAFTSESTFVATATKKIMGVVAYTSESTFVPTATKKVLGAVAYTSESTFSAVGSRKAMVSAAFTSESDFTVSGKRTSIALAAFTSETTFSAVGSRKAVVSAVFTSESTFVPTATKIVYASVAFTSESTFTAVATKKITPSITFTSESTFSAISSRIAVASIALTSESTFVASGTISGISTASVEFTAQSDFTISGKRISIALAAFTAETTFVPTATKKVYASAAFTAESTFVPTANKKILASAAFTSESTFTAAGSRKAVASAAFTSETIFSAVGSRKAVASAAFTSETIFNVVGSRKAMASAAFTSETDFTVYGKRISIALAAFTAESSMVADGSITGKVFASAAFTAESSMAAIGSRKALVSAAFTSESIFVASGTTKVVGAVTFTAESAFMVSGSKTSVAMAVFSAQSTLNAAGTKKTFASADFTSQTTFSAIAVKKTFASAVFTSESVFDAHGHRQSIALAAFTAETDFSVVGSRKVHGAVGFIGESSMVVASATIDANIGYFGIPM